MKNKSLLIIIIVCVYSLFTGPIYSENSFKVLKTQDDSLKNKVLYLCNNYVDSASKFCYGAKYAAFRKEVKPIDGKYRINCSTFSMLVYLGINFENSKYKGGNNESSYNSEYINILKQWFSDGGIKDDNIKYSRDIARKLYEDGYGLYPNEDFSNIDTGDILFFNLDPSNDRPDIDFLGIDHSAIFGYKMGDKYLIYEVGDDNGPRKILKTKESMKKVVLIGKFLKPVF